MSMSQQTAETLGAMAVKAAPPIAVVAAPYVGWTVPDWVQIITLVYVSLMVVHKLWAMGWGAYKFWVLKWRE